MADYLRGHPDHPKQIKDGSLAHDGSGGLRFRKSMASVMPLPNQPKPPDVMIELPEAELRAISVGALRQGAKIALGGLAPVGEDLTLGLGGIVGGGESGAITCVIERGGARHMIFFWAEAGAARGLIEGLARERVALGLRPLPRLEDLDAGAEASDRAERRDRQLAEIGEQLRAQTALLERIARALELRT